MYLLFSLMRDHRPRLDLNELKEYGKIVLKNILVKSHKTLGEARGMHN